MTTAYTATDGNTTDAVSGAEIGKVGVEWNKSKNSLHTSKRSTMKNAEMEMQAHVKLELLVIFLGNMLINIMI